MAQNHLDAVASIPDPKRRHFGPLAALRVQHYGLTFAWLPDPPHARWERLSEPSDIAVATVLPALPPLKAPKRKGRPPNAVANRKRLEITAVLRDLGGQSRTSVAQIHRVGLHVGQSELKMVSKDLTAARRMLAEQGVLPWSAWPGGTIPQVWWGTTEFAGAVAQWCEEAATRPSIPPALPRNPVLDYVRGS